MAAEEGEPGRAVAADPEPEAPARRLSRAGQGPQEGHRKGQNQPFTTVIPKFNYSGISRCQRTYKCAWAPYGTVPIPLYKTELILLNNIL